MSRRGPAAAAKPSELRCAIYTRKSSEEGLEQAFNSLHAQRDACEAYIRSQVSEGWSALPQAYDDGGISGGTMERPGLKHLLAEVEARRVDVVVVYKVDRLTRSLGDFARIVETFDRCGVSFVSVTQAFNTTTSMGRLTLNVLLSFAQFEREVTGERIRDKIALSKAKGMWMGGRLPLGYDARDHVLIPVPAEAELVREIFARYLKLGSVHEVCAWLNTEGIRSKVQVGRSGRSVGGAAFSRGALFHLLQNRTYLGEIVHRDLTYPGLHVGIVDPKLFEAVQKKLAKNRVVRRKRADRPAGALLTGRIFDGEGRPFSPTFSSGRTGRIHRYYVAADLQQGRANDRPDAIRRVGADALEKLVLCELVRLADRPGLGAPDLPALLRRLELRATDTQLVLDQEALFGLDHPELALEDLRSRLRPGERLVVEPTSPPALRISLPRRMQLRGGRTWITAQGDGLAPARPDAALIGALRRGHELLTLAEAKAPRQAHDHKLMHLAMLSPALQKVILDGCQPAGLTLARVLRSTVPMAWSEQEQWLAEIGKGDS